MTTEFQTGDLVTIEGKAGKVDRAEVADVREASEMPDLPIPESDLARQFIAEDFQRVAVIDYDYHDTYWSTVRVRFVTLQDFNGVWWDAQGHPLTIVKVGERA